MSIDHGIQSIDVHAIEVLQYMLIAFCSCIYISHLSHTYFRRPVDLWKHAFTGHFPQTVSIIDIQEQFKEKLRSRSKFVWKGSHMHTNNFSANLIKIG